MTASLASLDRYIPGNSLVHRADARVKLVVTFAFILTTVSLPSGAWPAYGAMMLVEWGGVTLSGVGLLTIFRRSLLALPFVLLALPTVFTKPGATLVELNLGLFHLAATYQGLEFFLSVMLKSWMAVTMAALLTATTPFLQIIEGLRFLRVPEILVTIISFMYRYLFVLVDEAQRMLRARSARSAVIGPRSGGSIRWRARVTGGMAGALFVRTYDRSERIYLAMLARGYDGSVRRLQGMPLRTADWLQVGVALVLFAAVAVPAQVLG